MSKNNLFRLNRTLHRDIGYLCIGFTIIFSLSGIALNHREDWNPNYIITHKEVKVAPKILQKELEEEGLISEARKTFSLSDKPKGQFWERPGVLKIFFPHDTTIVFNKSKGTFKYENIRPRILLRSFNGLHLNELKGYWIFFSDLYSVCLCYLAISALFMVKGKYGIKGRGGILTLIGLLVPAFFIYQIV